VGKSLGIVYRTMVIGTGCRARHSDIGLSEKTQWIKCGGMTVDTGLYLLQQAPLRDKWRKN
jgi:hypothetical protein